MRFLAAGVAVLLLACGSKSEPQKQSEKTAPLVFPAPKLAVPKLLDERSTKLPDEITLREVHVDRDGVPMTLWIYRHGPKETKRPAVFIAPAGTPLVWGNELTESDRPEHLPWALRGYLVVAYSLRRRDQHRRR